MHRPFAVILGYRESTGETPAKTWRNRCRALSARGGDLIPLERGAASADMQLCHSSCVLCYLSHLCTSFPLVRSRPTFLPRRFSRTALPKPWNDFEMLNNPVRWVQKVVIKVRLRSRSCPNMFVGLDDVEIISIPTVVCFMRSSSVVE